MQEKQTRTGGAVAWTGVSERKVVEKVEAWYVVWMRLVYAEIRSDAWYLEAILYAIFLILITWVSANAQDQSIIGISTRPHNILAHLRKELGAPFNDVRTPNDWYDFVSAQLLPRILPDTWYNGATIPSAERGWAGDGEQGDLRLVGAISIRQVRVQPNTCPTTYQEEFKAVVPTCYGEYSARFQDITGFGPVLDNGLERYLFSDQEANGEGSFPGQSNTYDGGGFRIVIPTDGSLEEAQATVAQLRADRWIDRQTRAVFITFNLFNPTNKYITVARFLLELPAAGGFLPKLFTRHSSVARLALKDARISTLWAEILMIFLVIAFILIEMREVSKEGWYKYLAGPWVFLDVLNLALFFSAYGFRYAALIKAPSVGLPTQSTVFMNLEPPMFCVDMWRNLLAVTVAVSWFKSIKYARYAPFLVHPFNCFFLALPDILSFLLVAFIVFFGFTLGHFLVYATDMGEFATLPSTMLTLWKQALGDLSARPREQRFSSSGAALFVLWTSAALLVLLNAFLGLLRDAFARLLGSGERVTIGTFLRSQAMEPLRARFKAQFLHRDEDAAHADTLMYPAAPPRHQTPDPDAPRLPSASARVGSRDGNGVQRGHAQQACGALAAPHRQAADARGSTRTQGEITREVEGRAVALAEMEAEEDEAAEAAAEAAEARRAEALRARRGKERQTVLLQALLTLSRETSVISRRLDTLHDTEAPLANDDSFFR